VPGRQAAFNSAIFVLQNGTRAAHGDVSLAAGGGQVVEIA
jgi:hypothetical protein